MSSKGSYEVRRPESLRDHLCRFSVQSMPPPPAFTAFHQGYVALPAMVGAVICLLMSLKRLSAAALKLFEDRAKANVHPASGLRSEP